MVREEYGSRQPLICALRARLRKLTFIIGRGESRKVVLRFPFNIRTIIANTYVANTMCPEVF